MKSFELFVTAALESKTEFLTTTVRFAESRNKKPAPPPAELTPLLYCSLGFCRLEVLFEKRQVSIATALSKEFIAACVLCLKTQFVKSTFIEFQINTTAAKRGLPQF